MNSMFAGQLVLRQLERIVARSVFQAVKALRAGFPRQPDKRVKWPGTR